MRHLFKYWIEEPIFVDKGVINIWKRKDALYSFCEEGIIPLIEKSGYRFKFNKAHLYKCIVNVVFTYFQGKSVAPYPVEDPYVVEQYDLYSYSLDSFVWENFWERWGTMQDFQEDGFAYKLRSVLPELLWSWIDLEISPKSIALHNELEEFEESEEGFKGKDDPYLQETSKRDYQDRHS